MLSVMRAKTEAALRWLFWTPAIESPLREARSAAVAPAAAAPPENEKVTVLPQKPLCSLEGCGQPRHARGLCSRHYAQERRRRAA